MNSKQYGAPFVALVLTLLLGAAVTLGILTTPTPRHAGCGGGSAAATFTDCRSRP